MQIRLKPNVREDLKTLKINLGLKSDSETVAYLISLYNDHHERLRYIEHQKYITEARLMNNDYIV